MLFTRHLRENNITWFNHAIRAAIWAYKTQKIAIALIIHSIFPFLFENYSSIKIQEIEREMNHQVKKG